MDELRIPQAMETIYQSLECLTEYLAQMIIESANFIISKDRICEVLKCCYENSLKLKAFCEDQRSKNSFGLEVFIEEFNVILSTSFKTINSESKQFSAVLTEYKTEKFISILAKQLREFLFSDPTQIICQNNNKELDSKEISDFVEIGYELSKHEMMTRIKNELGGLKFRSGEASASSFASIVGPSLMGKTQSAFSLSHIMNVIYINLVSKGSNLLEQEIYKPFDTFSKLFAVAIVDDINSTEFLNNASRNAKDFENFRMPLKTVGFLFTVFRMRIILSHYDVNRWFQMITEIDSIVIPRLTIRQFFDATKSNYQLSFNLFINSSNF